MKILEFALVTMKFHFSFFTPLPWFATNGNRRKRAEKRKLVTNIISAIYQSEECWWPTIADLQKQAQACRHLFFTAFDFFCCSAGVSSLLLCHSTWSLAFLLWTEQLVKDVPRKASKQIRIFSRCLLDTRLFHQNLIPSVAAYSESRTSRKWL